jgi:hypothetical protein
LEHPAATSLLPLARISKPFVVNNMPNTPVGNENVSSNKSKKLKGTRLSPETQVTLGGYYRGGTPPKKMAPFFRKNLTRNRAKYVSTKASSESRQGVDAHAGRTRESEIAYASARIRPFSLASGPADRSRNRTLPTRIRTSKGKNQKGATNKRYHLNLQVFEQLHKFYLFIYMAMWPKY